MPCETYFIHLCHDSVQHFALEWSENDCLIFDGIHNEPLSRLYYTGTDLIDCCYCYDKSILSGTCAFHFSVQFLFHCFHQLGPEILGMQQYFMLEGNLLLCRKFVCLVWRRYELLSVGRLYSKSLVYLRGRTFCDRKFFSGGIVLANK